MDVTHADAGWNTALHAIAYYGWLKMGQWLLDHGANINAKNARGETPLRVAQGVVVANMLHTEPKVAELLIKNGGKSE
jgi:ankyrin repeat protein